MPNKNDSKEGDNDQRIYVRVLKISLPAKLEKTAS